jgi:hypothetical protein
MSLLRFKTPVTYHVDWERFFTPYIPPVPTKPSPLRVITVHFTPPADPLPLHPVYKDSTDLTLVPNLELHSAAACGNVGLVHYALTHGQPVNSVLHGVLPLHAACSGGSVDVVKMLIERGANVNAPRLPRRYSDGRKSNAPSVGTAGGSSLSRKVLLMTGSTPLHFAAANGHAPIVQILLACGAVADKPDKNGMTPEALAEIQGHTEVIRVMRAWESLHPSTSTYQEDYPQSTQYTPSIQESEDGWFDGQQPSRKGKERAFSFSSAKSELNVPAVNVKVKRSIEGFFRRSSRSGSSSNPAEPTPLRISTYSDGSTEVSTPNSPAYYSTFVDSAPSSPHITTADEMIESESRNDAENSLSRVTSGNSTILAPPHQPFRASSPMSNISGGSSTVLASARQPREPDVQDTIDETDSASIYEEALDTMSHESLPEPADTQEEIATGEAEESLDEIPSYHRHVLPTRHGFSSRRPSLPAILEKAAHPGQTFRNAIRRDRHASESIPNIPEDPQQPKSGSFLRGRKSTQEPSSPQARRFGFKGFFKRGVSPPSRSPSPPKQNAILPDELDERLRRASLDMQSEASSDGREEVYIQPMPHSAPPTKTRFFEDLSDNSDLRMAALASLAPKTASPVLPPVRKVSGGVNVPSPLAKEWRDQDIAPTAEAKFRRTRTEVYRGGSPSPRISVPGTPVHTKKRSATLPSQSRGMDWDEEVSLRRAAASEVIRRNSEKLRQAVEEAEARSEVGSIKGEDEGSVKVDDEEEIKEAETAQETTPRGSDEEDITPEATPAVEKPEPDHVEYQEMPLPNRHRGESIGSFTTESTRLSTPSQSTNPHASIASGGDTSELYPTSTRSPKFTSDKTLRAPPISVVSEGRKRGNTVSSYSSGTSAQNPSTPGTSLTPTSAVFPPVPEHEVAPTSPRKALTREEAKKLVKQNEQDILQLAQLPTSVDSSRSLAEQLAAYGENHQLEQQIAAEERRSKRRAARSVSRSRGSDGDEESFVSATDGEGSYSGESSGGRTTGSSALRMTTIKHDKGESIILVPEIILINRRDVPSGSTQEPPAQHQYNLRQACSSIPRETPSTHFYPTYHPFLPSKQSTSKSILFLITT